MVTKEKIRQTVTKKPTPIGGYLMELFAHMVSLTRDEVDTSTNS